ncbi:MAG: hypothetical protein NT141_04625, partial [candidate division WWE3 bacterium]|nr:hypothetical protein [candidate division WWE3 bacterium]
PSSLYQGTVDDLKIYTYPRSPRQILEDMQMRTSPAPGSAISANGRGATVTLKFDEGFGTTTNNSGSAGSPFNGTLNSTTWSQSGKYAKGVTLSGSTGSFVSVPDVSY